MAKKLENYKRLISVEGRLAHSQSGIDFTKYPRTVLLSDIISRRDPGFEHIPSRFKPEQTIGEVLDQIGGINYGRYFVEGTPSTVADAVEKWLDEDDLDGINLVQYHSFETARDFVELVVPEAAPSGPIQGGVQRRGDPSGTILWHGKFKASRTSLRRALPRSRGAAWPRRPAAISHLRTLRVRGSSPCMRPERRHRVRLHFQPPEHELP